MAIENPFEVLGITEETPHETAQTIFRDRVLPLYPNGTTTPETFDEFDLLTRAWRQISHQLPRHAVGTMNPEGSYVYTSSGHIESYAPAAHTLDVLA